MQESANNEYNEDHKNHLHSISKLTFLQYFDLSCSYSNIIFCLSLNIITYVNIKAKRIVTNLIHHTQN